MIIAFLFSVLQVLFWLLSVSGFVIGIIISALFFCIGMDKDRLKDALLGFVGIIILISLLSFMWRNEYFASINSYLAKRATVVQLEK